ncbi:hypothetical protein GWL_38040 [Herbaspirillum sp. GW103]|nr:hypothetical protein GWL_38040 [Herbaspirillum sp. GW103]
MKPRRQKKKGPKLERGVYHAHHPFPRGLSARYPGLDVALVAIS